MNAATGPNPFATIALAALIVGVLDGLDAVVFTSMRGVRVDRLFQFIASSLLGRAAFSLGGWSVALGVVLHLAVAFALATAFWLTVQIWPRLKLKWFWSGVVFGLISYAAMNYAVLPLTRVMRAASQPWPALVNGILAHVFLVGVPIAFVVWRREGIRPVKPAPATRFQSP